VPSIHLTLQERQILLDYFRQAVEPEIRLRAHILLLLDAGHPWAVRPFRTGNSNVFRYAILRPEFPYVFAESGLRRPEQAKCRPADGGNRTFFDSGSRAELPYILWVPRRFRTV